MQLRIEAKASTKFFLFSFLRPAAAFLLPFGIYVKTLAPTIYNLDSAELTTAAATLGITRATGYPLYTLVGHLWAQIPVGDVGFRMNLFSAFCGALTLMLADQILARWKIRPIAAFFGLGLLATAPYFWYLSAVAEVYTLQTALMAAILLALVDWEAHPTSNRLAAAAFWTGLSATNHAAAFLLIPGILFFVLYKLRQGRISLGGLLLASFSGLAPLCLYLYLPIRSQMNPAFNYAGWYDASTSFHPVQLNTWAGFWWLVSGKAFRGLMFQYHWIDQMAQAGRDLLRAFFLVGLGPGLLGVYTAARRNPRNGGLLIFWFVITFGFYLGYQVADKATMFLPCYLVWALWSAVGAEQLLTWVESDRKYAGVRRAIYHSGLAACVLFALIWNWAYVDQSGKWESRTAAEKTLKYLPNNAMIIGFWDAIPTIEYLQKVEGARRDVTAINLFLIPPENYLLFLTNAEARQPVFLISQPQSLPPGYRIEAKGHLFQLVLTEEIQAPR